MRSFWDDTLDDSGWTNGGTGWSIGALRLTTRAWCRWINEHPEVTSWSFWSYDQHSTRLGNPPTGIPDDPNNPFDDADDVGAIVQASTLYDPGSPYFVQDLKTYHDTVLRHGGSAFSFCP